MNVISESEQLRAFFNQTGQRRQYQKNELILRGGDEPDGVYLIESGFIKIFVLDRHGTEHITHFFGPGDFFPLIWLFLGHIRKVNYETLNQVSLLMVTREDFMGLMNANQTIMYEMLEEMAERYLRYAGRIENLLYSDSRERCAYRLLSLVNRFGQESPEGRVINAGITQEDMARSVNMTRETFGRCLSRFQQKGWIGYDHDRRLVIKDLSALVKVIGREEAETTWPELMKYIID